MTNTHASKIRMHAVNVSSKKRTWRDGAYEPFVIRCHRSSSDEKGFPRPTMTKKSVFSIHDPSVCNRPTEEEEEEQLHEQQQIDKKKKSFNDLPLELVSMMLTYLDGDSLLKSGSVCRSIEALTHDRLVWKNICLQEWPTLQTQTLPQLPGAPDYDLIRLYGGSWRKCFIQRNCHNQRAELQVEIPHFPDQTEERIVSETFTIGEHHFCLWIFPRGNPHEQDYSGRVLSVYLVLTDLEQRPPDWLTCAVFSLSVINHQDPSKKIEWHSCLIDNKFDRTLFNWGVHSLGSLEALKDHSKGFLKGSHQTLTVAAKVRLMTITFRIVFEWNMKQHNQLGLCDLYHAESIVLPFCCTLDDLLKKLQDEYGIEPNSINIWCFNQPVISGQALRPRKLLTHAQVDPNQPMFGTLLCDGVDIDAYSFCQIYIESKTHDDKPLDVWNEKIEEKENHSNISCGNTEQMILDSEETSRIHQQAYIFVKVMNPRTNRLEYVGRMRYQAIHTIASIYECVAKHFDCCPSQLLLFKEEIAPTIVSKPLLYSKQQVTSTEKSSSIDSEIVIQPGDIVIFTLKYEHVDKCLESLTNKYVLSHYQEAERLLNRFHSVPTLDEIEMLGEKLDIPKFRIRSAFRKCGEDGNKTLKYIMEGRHLGFICDSCGETDFKGPRYNCHVCSDYDLCHKCNAECHEVTHRYANVDGKWQRIYDFKDHIFTHSMRKVNPVFYEYVPSNPAFFSTHTNKMKHSTQQKSCTTRTLSNSFCTMTA